MSEQRNGSDWRTLVILFALAAAYRVLHYFFFSDFIVAGSDMMQNQLLAAKFASGNISGVLDPYWPPLYGVVVGAVTFFIDDLIIPAVIVSIIAGSLVAPLTYVLTSQSYSRSTALAAGALGVFYPYLLNTTFDLGTENIYLVVILGSLICGWWAIERGSVVLSFVTGLLLALAYLTRPEAIGYLFLFLLFLALSYWRNDRPALRPVFTNAGALVLGFVLLAAPYIGYLRHETGVWTVSNKASVNLAGGVLSPDADRNTAELTTSKVEGRRLLREMVDAERIAQGFLQDLAPLFLFIFVALGLFGTKWSSDRLFREAYLLTFFVLTTVGYIVTVVIERYFYVLLPIVFAWMSKGFEEAEDWLTGSLREWNLDRFGPFAKKAFVTVCIMFAFAYMFTLNFYVRSTESTWQSSAFEERDAGIWIRENGPASPRIFSGSFRPVFYAKGSQVWTETESGAEILNELKTMDVDYVIFNDRSIRKFPYLSEFSSLLRDSEDFELVYENNEQEGYGVWVYKPISKN